MNRPAAAIAVILPLCCIVTRIILALNTDLSPDEAYYWTWSLRPAAGYFDHPPLLAWLINASCSLAGQTVFGIRMVALLSGIASCAGLYLCARLLNLPVIVSVIAVTISACGPLAMAGGFLTTPDAPLVAAWIWALAFSLYAVNKNNPAFWYAAGLMLGIGLNSKFSMAMFPLVVLIALFSGRGSVKHLKTPHPYLATVAGIILWVPNLLWMWSDEWSSLRFQLAHAFWPVPGPGPLLSTSNFASYAGAQIGLLTPLAAWWWFRSLLESRYRKDPAFSLVFWASVIPLASGLVLSFIKYQEPNWAAVGHPAAMLAAAVFLYDGWKTASGKGKKHWTKHIVAASILPVLFTAIAASHVLYPWLPLDARRDPTSRLHGWKKLADISELGPQSETIVTDGYASASEISFYAGRKQETTFSLDRPSPFLKHGDWLLVTTSTRELLKHCENSIKARKISLERKDGEAVRTLTLFRGKNCRP